MRPEPGTPKCAVQTFEWRTRKARRFRSQAYLRISVVRLAGVLLLLEVRLVDAVALLELAHPRLVSFDLLLEDGVLNGGALLVELERGDAVEPFEVHPTLPANADAVHDEARLDVDLQLACRGQGAQRRTRNWWLDKECVLLF